MKATNVITRSDSKVYEINQTRHGTFGKSGKGAVSMKYLKKESSLTRRDCVINKGSLQNMCLGYEGYIYVDCDEIIIR